MLSPLLVLNVPFFLVLLPVFPTNTVLGKDSDAFSHLFQSTKLNLIVMEYPIVERNVFYLTVYFSTIKIANFQKVLKFLFEIHL